MLSSPLTDAIWIRINIGRILISGERQGLRHPLEIGRNISPHLLRSIESEMIKISLLCHFPSLLIEEVIQKGGIERKRLLPLFFLSIPGLK